MPIRDVSELHVRQRIWWHDGSGGLLWEKIKGCELAEPARVDNVTGFFWFEASTERLKIPSVKFHVKKGDAVLEALAWCRRNVGVLDARIKALLEERETEASAEPRGPG